MCFFKTTLSIAFNFFYFLFFALCVCICACGDAALPSVRSCRVMALPEEAGSSQCREEEELVVIHRQQLPREAEKSAEFISIVQPVKLFNPPHCPRCLVLVLLLPIQLPPTTCCCVAELTTVILSCQFVCWRCVALAVALGAAFRKVSGEALCARVCVSRRQACFSHCGC